MKFLSYAYRFISNFMLLAMVYFSLNFLDKYDQRVVVAVLVLVYAAMRTVSALRTFYFFQRIERLEIEARRIAAAAVVDSAARRQVVNEVSELRRAGEMKSYIDLLFLVLIVLLCLSKIVTGE